MECFNVQFRDRADIEVIASVLDTLKFHEPAFRQAMREKIIASGMARAVDGKLEDAAFLFEIARQIDPEGPAVGKA